MAQLFGPFVFLLMVASTLVVAAFNYAMEEPSGALRRYCFLLSFLGVVWALITIYLLSLQTDDPLEIVAMPLFILASLIAMRLAGAVALNRRR